jgi:hypothetical protein
MSKTKPVLCAWVVCSCNSFDSCNKCGGRGGVYEPIEAEKNIRKAVEPEDRVRVSSLPYNEQLGTVESVDGAYCIIRLDSSKHHEDVREFYPNEFVVVTFCTGCDDWHEGRRCY